MEINMMVSGLKAIGTGKVYLYLVLINIQGIGRMVKKMGKVPLQIKMGINMLENGRMTKCMVKEHLRII